VALNKLAKMASEFDNGISIVQAADVQAASGRLTRKINGIGPKSVKN
jgi:3-methyladenine DNA glycosylase/8-oxoguanine DNA glycosylase